ncbi:MAG TPA: MFS transporter [Burkholderiaceae bacterium]|nr:MFS transporter [Burkholderiaceae bacterium]
MTGKELSKLIAGQVCLHACMAGMRMAAPLMALREGYSAVAVGVLLALFATTQVFLAIPAGRYTDQHGLRKPIQLSVIAASAGASIAVVFPVFPVLCLSALMTGGATGAMVIALQRHVGRSAQDPLELKKVFSWLALGPAVSNFIGPFSAGLLIDHSGFRMAFFFMALLPLLTWFLVRNAGEWPATAHVNDTSQTKSTWGLLKEPMMRRLMLVNWFLASCWDVHTFVVPILGHEKGLSASTIGAILGAFAISATLVRLLMPYIAKHLKEWVVVSGAMLFTGVLFGIYPFMPSAMAMGMCSVVLGFVLGSVQPMIMSTLHQITPENRHGEALGLRLMAINASSVAMPLIFGLTGTFIGVAGLFWVTGALVAAGSQQAWKLRPPS